MCYYCVHAMANANTANTETSRVSPQRGSKFCIDSERLSVKCSQCRHSLRLFVDSQLSSLAFELPAYTRVLLKSLSVLGQLKPWRCAFDGCDFATDDFRSSRLHARQCGQSRWTCRRRNHEGKPCGRQLDASDQLRHYVKECTTFYRCLRDPNLQNLTRRQFDLANFGQDSVALLLHDVQAVIERCTLTLGGTFSRLPLLPMVVQARRQIERSAVPQLRPT